jgi:diacylglycerol kinase (ATP)
MDRSRAFVLIAAGASSVARAERARALLAGAPGAGASRVQPVDGPAAAAAAVRAMERHEIPVAAGGDGTVNLVARALLETGRGARPFGVAPLGTGNAIAHSLGVARWRRALAALVGGQARPLDAMVTAHPVVPVVLASLSVGVEARFIGRYAGERASGRAWPLVRAALGSGVVRGRLRGVLVELDGRTVARPEEPLYSAGLYNHPTYAFGARVLPSASPWDGAGEAQVRRGPGAYWRAILLGARGSLAPPAWRIAVLETPEPVQVDGEPGPVGRFEARLAAGALRVLLPA